MKPFAKAFAIGCLFSMTLPVGTAAVAQSVTNVTFVKGSSAATVRGAIKGDQFRDYVVNARAGQTISVRKTGADIVYFNVMPPGSRGEAVFVGSTSGNRYSGTLTSSGNWRIRVYQMRATARRGEVGSFNLSISVTGKGTGNTSRPPDMGRPGGNSAGSIAGIAGMDAVSAIDKLKERGFISVDSFSSGNTLYGIYYYRPTRLCIQTTSANSRILDIRDIRTHAKCR